MTISTSSVVVDSTVVVRSGGGKPKIKTARSPDRAACEAATIIRGKTDSSMGIIAVKVAGTSEWGLHYVKRVAITMYCFMYCVLVFFILSFNKIKSPEQVCKQDRYNKERYNHQIEWSVFRVGALSAYLQDGNSTCFHHVLTNPFSISTCSEIRKLRPICGFHTHVVYCRYVHTGLIRVR